MIEHTVLLRDVYADYRMVRDHGGHISMGAGYLHWQDTDTGENGTTIQVFEPYD